MSINIDSYGMSRTYNDGHLIHGIDYNADYDGDKLNFIMHDNSGKIVYMKMNNDEIMDLLNKDSNKQSLHNRIKNDFTKTRTKKKTNKKTRSKSLSKNKSKSKSRSKRKSYKKSKSLTKSIDKTVY